MPEFAELPLLANIAIFAVAAAFVWAAGTRLPHYADVIGERTGASHALMGMLLIASVTSMPEVAVSLTAAARDNPPLAVNGLLGGIAMQISLLAIADAAIGRGALTAIVPDPVILLQGALNMVLLSIVAAAIVVGDVSVFGAGLWSWGILGATLLAARQLARAEGREPWSANVSRRQAKESKKESKEGEEGASQDTTPLSTLAAKTVAAAAVILVAGFLVSRTGEAIGDQTGIGASFAGVAFLALATSLPDISTVLSAVRMHRYTMAIAEIFGGAMFSVILLFAIDLISGGEPVLNQVGRFSLFGALLCIVLTGIFLAGIAERRDRTILRMGTDSALVLIAYIGGLVLLYSLRETSS